MKSIRKCFCFTSLILLLLFAGTYACTRSKTETPPKTGSHGDSSNTGKASISGLLASMDMYYFSKPVQAPDFELLSLDGKKISLNQYRGNVILLSFWATW
jgi:cytochrome oxidase Cu insertion factor (SCO1/SenC/PrrC family)